MRVLVTGGSSRIGSQFAETLSERGDEVVAFQRRPATGLDGRIVQQHGDITDPAAVDGAAAGCDAIVHLAAKVGVVGAYREFESVNVDGTRNVVDAAQHHRVRRLVHVSSPSVAHTGEPIVGAPAEPAVVGHGTAAYPQTKAIAERVALAADSSELGVVAVRPHLVWGPGDTQLVGRIVERAAAGRLVLVGGGRALVDTTYVDNAVAALVASLDAVEPGAPCSGRAYVVSNGEPRPVRELVAGICAAAGVPFAPRDVPLAVARRAGRLIERAWPLLGRSDEPPLTEFLAEQLGTAHWFDLREAKADLGWNPTVSIADGLAALTRSFEAESVRPR